MGRRKKTPNSYAPPNFPSFYQDVIGSMKEPQENHTSFVLEKSKSTKRRKSSSEDYGSVTPDVFNYTARSQEMKKKMQEMLSGINRTGLIGQSVNLLASGSPLTLRNSSRHGLPQDTEEKYSCRKVLFPCSPGSSSIDGLKTISVGSLDKSSTLDFGSSIQHDYDKHFSGSPKSLDVSGTVFPLLESGSDVIECRDMVIQEAAKISQEDNLLSSEPASEKNGMTKLSISVEVFEDLSAESTDDVDCLLLNENNLQQGKGKKLCLVDDTGYKLDSPFECQSSYYLQENDMEEAHKAKHEESLSENIDGIWKKGEVNWTEMNELERAIENLEDNTDDCCKELQALRDVKKVATEGGKKELNFMVETTEGFEDATNDTEHYLLQNTEKLDEIKMGEPAMVAEGTILGPDFADDTQMDLPWQRDMQSESDEDENDEFASMWKQMSLSFQCSKIKSTQEKEKVSASKEEEMQVCSHSFTLEDDLGYVCTLCGLIGRSIETIFEFHWSKARKAEKHSRHAPNRDLGTILGINNAEPFNYKSSEQGTPVVKLVLHPRLRKHMKSHQIDGFNFLQKNLIAEEPGGCILAHAPGTGKTFLMISFIQSFLTKYPEERPLIVSPKSILGSWMKEFKKWGVEEIPVHNLYDIANKAETLRYNQLQTLREWKEKKSILLVSYSQFSSIVCEKSENQMTECCQKILLEGPGLLVLDEGHFPRNKDTNILHALSQIHTRRRVLLSGTLFQNNFKELFNLLRLVRPNILDLNSFQAFFSRLISIITATEKHPKLMYRGHVQDTVERIFSEVLGYALQSSTEEVKRSTLHDLQELTSLFVHYYKGDVLEDLPGLVDFTVMLNLNDKQRGALGRVQHLVGNRMTRDIMSSAVCIHPSLEGENPSGWLEPDMTNIGITLTNVNADPNDGVKTKFVLDILSLCETNKEKLLVFSQYLPPLTLLEKMLMEKKNWSKGSEILRLDGNTHVELRENIIEQFNQDSDSKVLFASIRACGEGICLTGASRVIILDTPWNPSITRQAISRAYRIGQKRKVFAYRLVAAGTLEEEINQASLKKELMSKMLFEGSDQHNNSVSLLSEVNVDECEDMFFQGDSPLKENIQTLYRHKLE